MDESVDGLASDLLSGRAQVEQGQYWDSDLAEWRQILSDDPCDWSQLIKWIKPLREGGYGQATQLCLTSRCDSSLVLKGSPFKHSYLANNPYSGTNVEVEIVKLLQEFASQTPHLPIYYGDFTCRYPDRVDRFLLVETALGDLLDRWGAGTTDFQAKVVLFQVVWTLAVIQRRYPTFRHNDLSLANLLVVAAPETGVTQYIWDDRVYSIPNIGYQVVLWDFNLSTIGGQIHNYNASIVQNYNSGCSHLPNQYIDLSKILHYLRFERVSGPEFLEFLDRVMPTDPGYYGRFQSLVTEIQWVTPAELLLDSWWDEFLGPSREAVSETYRMSNGLVSGIDPIAEFLPESSCDAFPAKYLLPTEDGDSSEPGREDCPGAVDAPPTTWLLQHTQNKTKRTLEDIVVRTHLSEDARDSIWRVYQLIFARLDQGLFLGDQVTTVSLLSLNLAGMYCLGLNLLFYPELEVPPEQLCDLSAQIELYLYRVGVVPELMEHRWSWDNIRELLTPETLGFILRLQQRRKL